VEDWGRWISLPDRPRGIIYANDKIIGGTLYSEGGRDSAMNRYSDLYAYDIAAGAWSTLSSCPQIGDAGIAASLEPQSLYVHTGYPDGYYFYKYDIPNDTWTQKADLPTYRWDVVGGEVNGTLYVIGGSRNQTSPRYENEAYDYENNTWITKTSVPYPTHKGGSCVNGNSIIVIGGWNTDSSLQRTIQIYDTTLDSWDTSRTFPPDNYGEAKDLALSWKPLDGVVYVIKTFIYANDEVGVWPYTLASDSWDWPVPRLHPFLELFHKSRFADVYKGTIYHVGGSTWDPDRSSTKETPHFFAFDPRHFVIEEVTATPSSVERPGSNSVQLKCVWHDIEDLPAGSYAVNFWLRDELDNMLGPFGATTYVKTGTMRYYAYTYIDPPDTWNLGKYDVKAKVSK